MRRVKTPDFAKRIFTPNELYGWPDVCQYEPQRRRERKKRTRVQSNPVESHFPPPQMVAGGIEI